MGVEKAKSLWKRRLGCGWTVAAEKNSIPVDEVVTSQYKQHPSTETSFGEVAQRARPRSVSENWIASRSRYEFVCNEPFHIVQHHAPRLVSGDVERIYFLYMESLILAQSER